MIENERNRFLSLSAGLTGIAISSSKPDVIDPRTGLGIRAKAGDLSPRNSPVDVASEYLRVLRQSRHSDALSEMLERVPSSTPPVPVEGALAQELLDDPTSGPLCRTIIKLWFLGAYYDPDSPRTMQFVVSSQAYKEAMVWKIMRAHPMGYSMWTFGHWSQDPPELDEFISFIAP